MKAEIIAVGTEILLGQIVNTNATTLSEELADLGIDVYYHTAVGDNHDRIIGSLEQAQKRSDLIVLCGGLGPTEDDLTKQTVADFLGEQLIYDQKALAKVESFFEVSKRKMTENNRQQAHIIEHGQPIYNPVGLACGCLYQDGRQYYLLLPGPPTELKGMLKEEVVPLFSKLFPQEHQLVSRYLHYIGIGESKLDTVLADILHEQTNPTVAPYAKSNEVMLRLTASGASKNECALLLDELEEKVQALVGEYFYAYGKDATLEEIVVQKLLAARQTVAVIEAASGGECQRRLSQIPNFEAVCAGGMTVPNKLSKERGLGLSSEQLQFDGEISLETTIKMAQAGQRLFGADYTVAITCVAGPESIETQVPGTIILALLTPNGLKTQEMIISRDRTYIKDGAVKYALELLRVNI